MIDYDSNGQIWQATWVIFDERGGFRSHAYLPLGTPGYEDGMLLGAGAGSRPEDAAREAMAAAIGRRKHLAEYAGPIEACREYAGMLHVGKR